MDVEKLVNEAEKENFPRRVVLWYEENGRKNLPWRKNTKPYNIFVAEFLLQQTNVGKVKEVYPEIISKYKNVESLAESDLDNLEGLIQPLGLTSRAERMKKSAEIIKEKHSGEFPRKEELLELPGVGRYTANSIVCFGLDEPVPILDVNVARVFHEYFKIELEGRPRNNNELWQLAGEVLPQEFKKYNWGLLDLGAEISGEKTLEKELNPYEE